MSFANLNDLPTLHDTSLAISLPSRPLTMYRYTAFDRRQVHQRAAQYRDQLQRHLSGELSDDDFRPLRLQNGWYVQRHAPMLRVAVPYGELSARQLRTLAVIARDYDLQDAGLPR